MAERSRLVEIELGRLAGRLDAARERARGLEGPTSLDPGAADRALAAIDARLAAGKDRPSQALPLRRQVLGAVGTALSARADRLRTLFEIEALTTEAER
jgi:hypothetical protein